MKKLQIIGNVGQDAKIIETTGSKGIAFSVAVNEKFRNSDGTIVEKTLWVNCVKWVEPNGSTAVAQYIKAGTKIYVEGNPEVRAYTTKEGQPAAELKCNVYGIELLDSKREESKPAAAEPAPQPAAKPGKQSAPAIPVSQEFNNNASDDLPF